MWYNYLTPHQIPGLRKTNVHILNQLKFDLCPYDVFVVRTIDEQANHWTSWPCSLAG